MRRFILPFVLILAVVSLGWSQTGTVINDLTSNPTLRKSFINAENGGISTSAGSSVLGVLPVANGCGFSTFATTSQYDTVVIPGYRYATTIIGTVSTSATPGAVDSTVITYSPVTSTSSQDTVIFARSRATPSAKKFAWWVINW